MAVSGGVDSITLLDLLYEVSSVLKLKLAVAHVHHGIQTNSFRDEAQIFTHCLCEGMEIPFFTNTTSKITQKNSTPSEESLRKLRYSFLRQWMKQCKAHYLVLAHTSDDLLETRLIRLIRGTGAEGLASMHFSKDHLLRPLLTFTKKEIQNYAHFKQLIWLEDPSNYQSKATLRNWIRQKWLPQLEKKRCGSIRNLSKSLHRLCAENPIEDSLPQLLTPQGLDRKKLIESSYFEQKRALVKYIRMAGLNNYTEGHIQEILKRIHSQHHKRKFFLLGKYWLFTDQYVKMK